MKPETRPQFAPIHPQSLEGPIREHLGGIEEIVVFRVPLNVRFRGVTSREGLLLRGAHGWGECSPFWDYTPRESSKWLRSALLSATTNLPRPERHAVPVNLTVPICSPEEVIRRIANQPGCKTAKVKVADSGELSEEDVSRVHLVAQELGRRHGDSGRVRIDANCAWSVEQAADALRRLDRAAEPVGGLEYAEQPCAKVQELALLRRKTTVPIAADESIRRSATPLAVRDLDAADVAVLKVAPLGGIPAALGLARDLGLPTVVSSALDTSIGLAAGVVLASSLPELSFACGLNTGSLLAADVIASPLIASLESGELRVEDAKTALTSELSSHADVLHEEVVQLWIERLRKMVVHLDQVHS